MKYQLGDDMRFLLGAIAGVGVLTACVAAHATTFPVRECRGCTAEQARVQAKNLPPGYAFIYDLPAHVIRKFEVYMDSTCVAPPEISGAGGAQTKSGDETDCGSFRDAAPAGPVDSSVQVAFDDLYHVYQVNQQLALNAKAEYRGDPPENPRTHDPFDLVGVAYDYPGQSYEDFYDFVRDNLGSRITANQLVPGLGDWIYGWTMHSATVAVGVPPDILSGSLTWDRNSGLIGLWICTPNGDCAKFDVQVTSGAVTAITYRGVFDVDGHIYPSASGDAPGSATHWRFGDGSGAEHFRQMLSRYTPIPYGPCGGISYLNTVRLNGRIIFQSWECGVP